MVYRKTRTAATSGFPAARRARWKPVATIAILSSLVAWIAPPTASAAAADPLAVVDVDGRAPSLAGVTDWSEILPVRTDLGGGKLLVEMDAATWRATSAFSLPLQLVDSEPAGATLYRVTGVRAAESRLLRPAHVLWSSGEQFLVRLDATPGAERDLWSLAGTGIRLYKVPDHPIAVGVFAGNAATVSSPNVVPDTPAIDEIVSKILAADITAFDTDLVAFGTRESNEQGGLDAQAYLVSKFQSFGLTQIAQDSVGGIQAKNVCATLTGTSTPEKILVIGAHYDSITQNPAVAPGADDDGSGTAGMLAIASVMSQYHFESTIMFCGFAGEELGLLGSQVTATALKNANANVIGMVELDMIGYLEPGDAMDVDVLANASSASMRGLYADVVTQYLPSAAQVDGQIPQGASSDHASFWQEGYPALLLFEDSGNYTPFLHTSQDVMGTSFNSPELATETAQSTAALMAVMAVPSTGGSPTPTPTATPGGNSADGGIVHGGCACDLSGLDASTTSSAPVFVLGALLLAATRRRARRS